MGDSLQILKAHAYGNDFLYAAADDVSRLGLDAVALALATCARHTGIGADGLILHGRRTRRDDAPAERRRKPIRGVG